MKINKNVIGIIGCFFVFLFLNGCQKKEAISVDYDIAIIDEENIITFKEHNNQLKKMQQQKRTDGNLRFWRDTFWEMDGSFYTKTSESLKQEVFLAKIDKDLSIKTVKAKGNDAYTSNVDGDFFYTTACFAGRTEFYKYDKELKLVAKKVMESKNSLLTNQLLAIGDYLYVLGGIHNPDTGTGKNVLLKMNKNFDVEEEIDLGDENSAYLRMIYFKKNLYISEGNSGTRDDGQPGEGKRILVYNLENKEKSYLSLTYPYPMELYIDEKNDNLIIRHYELYVKSYTWTIYSLTKQTEDFIHFPEYEKLEQEKYIAAPFFTQKNGEYYFMFDDQITKYHPLTKQQIKFDLSKYHLNNTHTLIVNKDE